MKKNRKTKRFDYSKIESGQSWDLRVLSLDEYWGFHKKSGRLHIDTKRYKKVCNSLGITEYLPNGLFAQRSTVYYEPSRIKRNDYKVNIFRDYLGGLKSDWENEYKPLFKNILTPEDVEKNHRTDLLMYSSSADDYDNACITARIAGLNRITEYNRIFRSFYCQFIQRVSTEVDRYILTVMVECGSKDNDFSMDRFRSFSDGLLQQKGSAKLSRLSKYHAFNLLHKLNNFLKHNSIDAYDTLRKLYPGNVESSLNGKPYQNGMFAGDWIIVKPNYIDDLLDKLIVFFEDYCRVYLKEDIEQSKWDYDEYFINAKHEMQDPYEYFGLSGLMGGPWA